VRLVRRPSLQSTAAVALLVGALGGCGSSSHPPAVASRAPAPPAPAPPAALLAEARPIGRGVRFQPPVTGRPIGACTRTLGPRSGVHVEVFGANRVVLIPAGVGIRDPGYPRYSSGRIVRARCYGALVTLDPTGLVLVRPGARLTLGDLFAAWGQPLSARRIASFVAGQGEAVRVFVDGRPRPGPPASVPLRRHAEIVLEVGPYVPPHTAYAFPPGT
jgi:hypothetical protein